MSKRTSHYHHRRLWLESLENRTLLASGVGVFAPDSATWSLRSTASPGEADVGTFQYSIAVPVVGDWNGDGRDDIGSFNRSTATWSLRYGASEGVPDAGVFIFGQKGALPVVGDWNGDGRDDVGTFHPSTATWTLRLGASGGPATGGTFKLGAKGTLPVVGDWDGDGKDGIGTFNKSTLTWALRQVASAGVPDAGTFKFGAKATVPVVGDWNGDGKDGIGSFKAKTGTWSLRQVASAGAADVGTFVFGAGIRNVIPLVGDFTDPAAAQNALATLTLKPLDIDLLGLKIQSSPITATVSAEAGDGKLLGNLLTTVDSIIDVNQINGALNNVLGATVDLLNSVELAVNGVGSGVFDTAPVATTQVLELFVAPVHLNVLGAHVDTSPIRLSIQAEAGPGRVLGNVLTALTNLFNPPLPDHLDLTFINGRLTQLLSDLTAQVPGIAPAQSPAPVLGEGGVLALTVPAIDLDLLGLELKTQPITVNASDQTGDGLLVGNILTTVFNTLGATPTELTELNGNINALLAQVVGILNAATLTLPAGALDPLSDALKQLALPDLVNATPGAEAQILDLVIASPDSTPPVKVDLLGLNVTVGNVDATLSAHTGDGQVLGNLLYNVANLVNPGGPASLISLLTTLGSGTTSNLLDVTTGLSPTATSQTRVLTLTLPPLDLNLLGVEVKTAEPITVTLTAERGDGLLLGNVLTAVSSLLNLQGVGNALNNVLSTTVTLLNNADLAVNGVGDGLFTSAPESTTPVLNVSVAPVHLDLLGLLVDTTPIELSITAHAGEGLVLGNVLTALTDLFNPPLPDQLDLAFINGRLEQLLADLTAQIPGVAPAVAPTPVLGPGGVLALTVPAIDLNLLGLVLQTDPITVNATAQQGDGLLLGNLLNTVLNTLNATPEELTRLNQNLNGVLGQVVGVLNESNLTLPAGVIDTLSTALQSLALPNLITATPGATATVLDLAIASDGTSPPVNLNLLGLLVTTSNIKAKLSAQTGDGQVLGNLLYNVSNLLNSGSAAGSLLSLLGLLGV
jgi:hypothetical protein